MRTSTKVMEQRPHPDVSSLWLAASGLCIVSLAKLIMVGTKEANKEFTYSRPLCYVHKTF